MMNIWEVAMLRLVQDVASLASLAAFAAMLCVWADIIGRAVG
jgi:hypothetical protein